MCGAQHGCVVIDWIIGYVIVSYRLWSALWIIQVHRLQITNLAQLLSYSDEYHISIIFITEMKLWHLKYVSIEKQACLFSS